jgi:hypothetical protein
LFHPRKESPEGSCVSPFANPNIDDEKTGIESPEAWKQIASTPLLSKLNVHGAPLHRFLHPD